MAKIGLVGPTSQQRSLPFDAQRTVNFYPVLDKMGKEVAALYGTPGLASFSTTGDAPVRGSYCTAAERAFVVSGPTLYEIAEDGTATSRGTLESETGPVTMDENGFQLAICDGEDVYIYTYEEAEDVVTNGDFADAEGWSSSSPNEHVTDGDFAEYQTNGLFTSDSGWTKGVGWSISSGKARATGAISTVLSQTAAVTLIEGITYTITYTVTRSAGTITPSIGGTAGVARSTSATFTETIVCGTTQLLAFTGAGFTGTIDAVVVTAWVSGAGWLINSGIATATSATSSLEQDSAEALVNGRSYLVTYDVGFTSGSVAMSLGGGTPGTSRTAAGTYTETIVAGATQKITITGAAFTGTIDNVTVKPGWTITGGQAVATGAITDSLTQTAEIALVEGRAYEVIYTVTVSAGTVSISLGGTIGTVQSASGTYTETIIAGSTQEIAINGIGFTGTVDNLSATPDNFAKVTAEGLPEAGTITFIDGYFVVNKVGTGQFNISGLYNGFAWDPLDFATAESSPDELLRVMNAVGALWLLGKKTTEIWTNTGASSFPFERTAGGKMETGVHAPLTVVAVDNSILWIGSDAYGSGVVFRAQGYTAQRISTTPIEKIIQESGSPEDMVAYTYQQDGHVFYVITGGGLPTTLVYDISTQMWHERAYLNVQGEFEQQLGASSMYAFNKHLVGSRLDGTVYEMSQDFYSDDGDEIASERIYTYVSDENKRIRYNRLEIGFETGVGLQTGQGSDPVCTLSLSKDGARTWTDPQTCSIGRAGEYFTTVAFRRLGVAKSITFKLRITDPVKRAITGSYLF